MILETYPQFLSETPIFWLFDGWMEPSLSLWSGFSITHIAGFTFVWWRTAKFHLCK
jgi:hypothetical protein